MKRLLPRDGTPESAIVKERFDRGEFQQLADELGFASKTSFLNSVNKTYDLHLSETSWFKSEQRVEPSAEPVIQHVPYPDLQIMPFPAPKTTRDEEDIGIVLTDWHLGKKTETFDITIAQARIAFLLDSIMSIINLHRPIRKLWVFICGDMVQGENPHQGSKIGEVECSVYEQVHTYAVPIISSFLASLLQGVADVEVVMVAGNHGKYDRIAPDKSNWDNFLYQALAAALVNNKGIALHPPETFFQLVNIRGFRFFIIHGNQVKGAQGIPLFAMRRKMQEWYAYVKGFNYGYCGHFHSFAADQVNSLADYTICPPLVTGDSWALEMVGRASEPKQLCFGVHDKYGRSFEYKLHTDPGHLPVKYNEPEGLVVQ